MRTIRQLFLWVGLSVLALPLQGQILNVEDARARRDTSQVWAGRVGLDFTLNNRSATPDNPVQFINVGFKANVARYGEESAWMFINQLNYSAITGNAFIRTGYSHLRYVYGYRKRLGFEAFAQGQYDLARGLKGRGIGGGGLRYNLVRGQRVELHAGIGGMYEYEHWQNTVTQENVYVNFFKSTNYLSFNWHPTEILSIHLTNYYQVGYDEAVDIWRHRVSLDALLEISVSDWLAFRSSLDVVYENAPLIPIFNTVYTLNSGIVVSF